MEIIANPISIVNLYFNVFCTKKEHLFGLRAPLFHRIFSKKTCLQYTISDILSVLYIQIL